MLSIRDLLSNKQKNGVKIRHLLASHDWAEWTRFEETTCIFFNGGLLLVNISHMRFCCIWYLLSDDSLITRIFLSETCYYLQKLVPFARCCTSHNFYLKSNTIYSYNPLFISSQFPDKILFLRVWPGQVVISQLNLQLQL